MHEFSILISIWYQKNARKLPWRSENDPYKIWLSEIILQQTRVDQGMDYYFKFVEHYPTIKDLALATEDQILNDWQGLGYYSRARNLHAAAKYVHQELNGKFPSTYQEILKLKGVGDYTASAIASFAFDLPHAVVDGNVYRVISRFLNIATPIDSTEGKKQFKKAAELLLNKKDPATHNQAIMELGALVCTPKKPDCDNCPVQQHCLGYAEGNFLQLPIKAKKTKVRDRYFHYFLLKKDNKVVIKKRGPNDVWQGLYDFPLIEKKDNDEPEMNEVKIFNVTHLKKDKEFKHVLSHQRIHATFWHAEVKEHPKKEAFMTIDVDEIHEYPMPQLLIRYLDSSGAFNTE